MCGGRVCGLCDFYGYRPPQSVVLAEAMDRFAEAHDEPGFASEWAIAKAAASTESARTWEERDPAIWKRLHEVEWAVLGEWGVEDGDEAAAGATRS